MGKKKNFIFTGNYGEVDTIKSIDSELFLWDVNGGGGGGSVPEYPVYTPKFYPMPEYGIEQPAYPSYPVQPIYATPTPEPVPIYTNPKFYYPMPEYPIEQPAYPSLPKAGIDFGTPVAYDIPEVPKFDVEPPTLYTPLPVYEPKPIDVESPMPIYSPIDTFIPPVTDVPPFTDDVEIGVGVVKPDVEPVKPDDFVDTKVDDTKVTTSPDTKLPETKPVSKNLTPYVYAGLGIVVILLVARMVTKKD